MKKQHQHRKSQKYSGEKLLSLPGISEVIDLVKGHAWIRAANEAIDKGSQGALGGNISKVINQDSPDSLWEFFEDDIAEAFITDSYDEWLELMALEAGPKIADLWGLSEFMGKRMSRLIYWSEYSPSLALGEADTIPIVLLIGLEGEKEIEFSNQLQSKPLEQDVMILSKNQIQNGHVYLDVTSLPFNSLGYAYRAIASYREYFGIKPKDIKAGAPSKIDAKKALEAHYLKRIGKSSKCIAKQLGFKIYYEDNPSGSYPLLHRYFKYGGELDEKLVILDKFLSAIHHDTNEV